MNAIKITVNAIISSDVKKVWDYYTSPKHITKWNFASDDWHCPAAETDLRVGGKMQSRMEAKDGSFGFDFIVVLDEVVAYKSLAYTMEDGRKATITFEQNQDKTDVEVTFDAENENPIELQRGGWQAILNNFKSYAETN